MWTTLWSQFTSKQPEQRAVEDEADDADQQVDGAEDDRDGSSESHGWIQPPCKCTAPDKAGAILCLPYEGNVRS